MELFEAIRREYEFGLGSIQGVARKLGVHRRLVREALGSAVPMQRPAPPRPRPRLGPVADFIEAILEADRRVHRKQRHTAHRIYVRLCKERPDWPVAEPTVRRYVRQRKLALGLLARETFVPQYYVFGEEAQVDWYQAIAELGGESLTLQVFTMRSMAGGGALTVYWADPREDQVCEETGEGVILIKDAHTDEVVGFERLYYRPVPGRPAITFETAAVTG